MIQSVYSCERGDCVSRRLAPAGLADRSGAIPLSASRHSNDKPGRAATTIGDVKAVHDQLALGQGDPWLAGDGSRRHARERRQLGDHRAPAWRNDPTASPTTCTNITMELRRPGLPLNAVVVATCPDHHHAMRVTARRQRRTGTVLTLVAAAAMSACSSDTPASPAPNIAATATGNTPIDAYRNYTRTTDAATRNPLSQDWSTQISNTSIDPERTKAIMAWKEARDLGIVFTGETTLLRPQVTQQTSRTATVADCINGSGRAAQQNGRPLPTPPGQPQQFQVAAEVTLDVTTWKVSDLQYFRDRPC